MFFFNDFREEHLPFLRQWLNTDHIKDFWQETEDDEKLKEKYLNFKSLYHVDPFVIVANGTPIGYIQYYEATKVGGGWWENETPGTFGIDLMIGSKEFHGRGFGSQIILEFVEFVRSREPSLRSVIIDPAPGNARAIRAFEKAGFIREAEITTPGGAALLMRIQF